MTRKPDHISQEAWDAVNSPELTDEKLAKLRPAGEALRPALLQKLIQPRGPQKAPTKEAVSLRLDRDVLDHFRAVGSGWQTKINEVLRQSVIAQAKTVQKNPARISPKTAAQLVSAGLNNPATLSPKDVKKIGASALTQRSGLSPATRRDKKPAK